MRERVFRSAAAEPLLGEEGAQPTRCDPHPGHFREIGAQPRRGPGIERQAEGARPRLGGVIERRIIGTIGNAGAAGAGRIGERGNTTDEKARQPMADRARRPPTPRGDRLPIGTEAGGFDHLQALAQTRGKRSFTQHALYRLALGSSHGNNRRLGIHRAPPDHKHTEDNANLPAPT